MEQYSLIHPWDYSGPITTKHCSIFSPCLNGWLSVGVSVNANVCVWGGGCLCSEKQRTCSLSAEWEDCRMIGSSRVGPAKVTCLQGHTDTEVFSSHTCNLNILLGDEFFSSQSISKRRGEPVWRYYKTNKSQQQITCWNYTIRYNNVWFRFQHVNAPWHKILDGE